VGKVRVFSNLLLSLYSAFDYSEEQTLSCNNSDSARMIFVDFAKAFDRVDHNVLKW